MTWNACDVRDNWRQMFAWMTAGLLQCRPSSARAAGNSCDTCAGHCFGILNHLCRLVLECLNRFEDLCWRHTHTRGASHRVLDVSRRDHTRWNWITYYCQLSRNTRILKRSFLFTLSHSHYMSTIFLLNLSHTGLVQSLRWHHHVCSFIYTIQCHYNTYRIYSISPHRPTVFAVISMLGFVLLATIGWNIYIHRVPKK